MEGKKREISIDGKEAVRSAAIAALDNELSKLWEDIEDVATDMSYPRELTLALSLREYLGDQRGFRWKLTSKSKLAPAYQFLRVDENLQLG